MELVRCIIRLNILNNNAVVKLQPFVIQQNIEALWCFCWHLLICFSYTHTVLHTRESSKNISHSWINGYSVQHQRPTPPYMGAALLRNAQGKIKSLYCCRCILCIPVKLHHCERIMGRVEPQRLYVQAWLFPAALTKQMCDLVIVLNEESAFFLIKAFS